MARVILTEEAREDFLDLDGATRRLAAKGLVKLETEPEKRGQPLGRRSTTNLTNFRKLVVGNRSVRIVYQVRPNGDVVVVWVIGRRADNEAYELAMARLRLHGDPAIRSLATSMEELWPR
ncbi:type II toxin-antitoxin system RelE family toxin [Pseudonocardia acaciae]|uniref:type II toxin-antitoxin system RelE family toxin n=1 Tax=Pseudonocardia acaciae TaxID=551276 RepID=UPI00048D07DF|nr:type II toxin-antitoxin system RelE/ParE family toxin [Pseudonocardia acaciae]